MPSISWCGSPSSSSAVLEGARLHLVGVARPGTSDAARPVADRHEAPLHAGGEAGAAAAAQVGVLDQLLHVLRASASCSALRSRLVAARVARTPPDPAARALGRMCCVSGRSMTGMSSYWYRSRMRVELLRRRGRVQVLVDHHRRAQVAGAEADDRQQREAVVGGGLRRSRMPSRCSERARATAS